MFYESSKFLCRVLCLIFFRLKAKGLSNIPKQGGFILACNHASYLDPVLAGSACPRSLNYLARDTLFGNWIFRWWLKNVHVIPLRRDSADLGAMKEALNRLKDGQGLILFPEGTRSVTGELGRGQHGVGFLARKSCVPVIPTYVDGSFKALPKGAKLFKPVSVTVLFSRALVFDKNTAISDQAIVDKIMDEIRHLKDSLPVRRQRLQ